MARISFVSVLKSNLKCACCREKFCPVRYYPEREKDTYSYGTRYVTRCKKDIEREEARILKLKLK